jgi:NAD(P)H-dependent FMN reductase
MSALKITIIIGSTREGRFGERPARWLLERAASRDDATFALADLRDYPLPFFEGRPPAAAAPEHPVARKWAALLGESDGFVFVTPEYNHAIPGVLKNAIDYAYTEWNRKPAGFLSYGGVGGARAVQALRLILIELQMAPLRNAVHIGRPDFGRLMKGEDFADFPQLAQAADRLLDDVVWWTRALKAARDQ